MKISIRRVSSRPKAGRPKDPALEETYGVSFSAAAAE